MSCVAEGKYEILFRFICRPMSERLTSAIGYEFYICSVGPKERVVFRRPHVEEQSKLNLVESFLFGCLQFCIIKTFKLQQATGLIPLLAAHLPLGENVHLNIQESHPLQVLVLPQHVGTHESHPLQEFIPNHEGNFSIGWYVEIQKITGLDTDFDADVGLCSLVIVFDLLLVCDQQVLMSYTYISVVRRCHLHPFILTQILDNSQGLFKIEHLGSDADVTP
ncbi:hypothetical protein CHS0354_007715 [Potamilus streckersoni]|uniref:Uncharacterized protein n=1 Tax=Potamilus streckersoni TaxID=2493646 RepID=A0AAE0T517_9BIVA|nr:hypothetical protein CHS0354_007715 [Potamilus streckersoni]